MAREALAAFREPLKSNDTEPDPLEPWEIRAKAVTAFKALSGWSRRDSVQAIKATEPRATPEDWAEAAWELRAGVR